MHRIDIDSGLTDAANVARAVAEAARDYDLETAQDGELKQYPGSRHWHLRRPREQGTLEVTHWPARDQLWVSYHANRAAPWVVETAPQFAQSVEEALSAGDER
jgi:hypothetical protein